MDTPLSGERIAEEKAFARRYLDALAARPVNYAADYAPPLNARPRKVPVVAAPVVAPPDMDVDEEGGAQDAAVTLTVKSLKPALTFTVSASVTDSVADLKALVAAQAGAPAADAQRLLLKGKALADSKLLKEYGLADGAVINLMVKPGAAASAVPATPPAATLASPVPVHAGAGGLSVSASSSAPRSPTLTITTPVEGALPTEVPGGLNFDDAPVSPVATKAFHDTAANPAFWSKLHTLLHSEFAHGSDADTVFDSFLVSMRGRLTASESAKIRDVVGVAGMGGGA